VRDAHGQPVIHAEAWETSVNLTANLDGEARTWTERCIVVRSPALQARQQQALERRRGQPGEQHTEADQGGHAAK
jgi:hypothetical protein